MEKEKGQTDHYNICEVANSALASKGSVKCPKGLVEQLEKRAGHRQVSLDFG